MALTIPRWIAAAIGGWLVLISVILRPEPAETRPYDARRTLVVRSTRAGVMAGMAARRLRAIQLRDSTLGSLSSRRATESRFVVGAGLDDGMRRLVRSLEARASLMRTQQPISGIDIAIVHDTINAVRGGPLARAGLSIAHVLPTTRDDRCLVLGRVVPRDRTADASQWWERDFATEARARTLLGPCGFYEAFGTPGQGIDHWLRNGGWKFGTIGAWNRRFPVEEEWNFYWWARPWFDLIGWPVRSAMSNKGYACVTGDREICRELVLEPFWTSQNERRLARIGREGVVSAGDYADWPSVRILGPGEPALLAEMVRSLGPERFQRFWRSEQPPADAFLAASGQDIGDWTAAWATRSYGERTRGPGVSVGGALFAVVLITLAVVTATTAARRRQVA